MIPLLTTLICYLIYLTLDAREDHELATKYSGFNHKSEVYLRATFAFSLLFLVGYTLLKTLGVGKTLGILVIFGLFMDAIGWAYFDFIYNVIGGFKWDRIGTGGIDKWFITKFGVEASYHMKMVKLIFIGLTGVLLFALLIKYHLI